MNFIWYGDSLNKGIAVFSKPELELKISNYHNPSFRYIIPIEVSGKYRVNIYAIWAMPAEKGKRYQRYIGQIYHALNYYQLQKKETLIAGDFNWNLNFDKNASGLEGNFKAFLSQMDENNFESAYHKFYAETFGEETNPTLYLQNQKEKPCHIDYIFGTKDMINCITCFHIGKREEWSARSDHMPLFVEFYV